MEKIYIFHREYYPRNNSGGPSRSISRLLDYFGDNMCVVVPYRDNGSACFDIDIYKTVKRSSKITIHLNSYWNLRMSWLPVLWFYRAKIHLSTRGEMYPEALNSGRSKVKYLFHRFAKLLLLYRDVTIVSSNEHELLINQRHFQGFQHKIIPNIGPRPVDVPKTVPLRFVSVGRCHPIKNFYRSVSCWTGLSSEYCLYLIRTDEEEFKRIDSVDSINVSICDPLLPELVLETLDEFSVLIAPSESENFGHTIAEALSLGMLVVLSKFTPWSEGIMSIDSRFILDLEDFERSFAESLRFINSLSFDDLANYRHRFLQLYNDYYTNLNLTNIYESTSTVSK